MPTPQTRLRYPAALLALVLSVGGAPWLPRSVVLAQSQTLFVSVVDSAGEPVTDLGPEELVVQWGGMDCETLNLEPVRWPVRVTLFVDNGQGTSGGIEHVKDGLRGFLREMPNGVEVALLTIAPQPRWLVRHTSDQEELGRGVDLVWTDSGAAARYLDGLVEEARRLDEDAEREYYPVIVMVTADGPEGSTSQQNTFNEMVQRMIESSATVHSLVLSRGATLTGTGPTVQVGMHLSDVTRGSYESIAISTGFTTLLPDLARDIARKHRLVSNQYRVTYAVPDGAPDQAGISVRATRPGLELRATLDGNIP